jgi:hypothetical protein
MMAQLKNFMQNDYNTSMASGSKALKSKTGETTEEDESEMTSSRYDQSNSHQFAE